MGRQTDQGIHPPGLTMESCDRGPQHGVLALLKSAGVRQSKRLGQHFITDRNLLRIIARLMVPDASFSVVEIGAGPGTLTRELSRVAHRVIAIEVDRRLKEIAERVLSDRNQNVSWIWDDVLSVDLEEIVRSAPESPGVPWVLCGNLPYYLTSELLYRVLVPRTSFSRLAFLVQNEVANRMSALPGSRDFGRLSLWCQYRGNVTILRRIPKAVFFPRPAVDSSLVALDFNTSFPLDAAEESLLDTISRYAFSQRRKTIANALREMFDGKGVLLEILRRSDVDPDSRPEQISVEAYVRLASVGFRLRT